MKRYDFKLSSGLALSFIGLSIVISPLFSNADQSVFSNNYYEDQMSLVNKAIESYNNSEVALQLQFVPNMNSVDEVKSEIPETPIVETFSSAPQFSQIEASEILQSFGLQNKFCEFCNGSKKKEMQSRFIFDDYQEPIRSAMLEVSNNSLSKKIERVAKKEKHLRSSGYCWRSVKSILVRAGLISEGELSTPIARDADADLKRQGFIDLMAPGQPLHFYPNPCLAPKGAVLVYSGGKIQIDSETGKPRCGKRPCGHVEVKASNPGESGVISDFMARESIVGGCFTSGHSYKLKAIMIPPELDVGLYDKITRAENLHEFVKSLFEKKPFPFDSK